MFLNPNAVFDMLSQHISHRHCLPFPSFLAPSLAQLLLDSSAPTEVPTPKAPSPEAASAYQNDRSSYFRYLEMHSHFNGGQDMRNREFGFSYSTQFSQLRPMAQPPSRPRLANWPEVESGGSPLKCPGVQGAYGGEQRGGEGDPRGFHEVIRTRPPDKKIFGCRRCSYVTDRKNNLKRHVMAMHRKCERMLECCGLAFDSKAALRDHVMAYHDNGYACVHCRRNFCRKALLRRHLAVHDGRKDYACADCGYATSHKSNLERHKKVHQSPLQPHNWTSSDVFALDAEERHQRQGGDCSCNSQRSITSIPNDDDNCNRNNGYDDEYIDVIS